MARHKADEFEDFARDARPRLVRAFIATRGDDAVEAAAEALAYAWEHWAEVGAMDNPLVPQLHLTQGETSRSPSHPMASTWPSFARPTVRRASSLLTCRPERNRSRRHRCARTGASTGPPTAGNSSTPRTPTSRPARASADTSSPTTGGKPTRFPSATASPPSPSIPSRRRPSSTTTTSTPPTAAAWPRSIRVVA